MDNLRPDPDEMLRHIQAAEQRRDKGKLKIFLGYAAGVGKTYAMLETAQQRKTERVDIVIGYIETHKRAETEALVEGLEIVPRRQIEYRGVVLEEMDIDAVLARKPRIALVDELAHTNAPNSRHPKRYQDVEELLEAGIDVYSTLNIQHLESLNDVVAQITGVIVRETLPDRIIDLADQIVLVDLPPEELIQRLSEGKVYVPDQASRAVQKFFRQGNLTALREMALRRTARRVDSQMNAYMQTRAIPGPWAAGERLLVSVSPSPLSEKLIRTGYRLASELYAEWHAVYIETPASAELKEADREQIARNLRLAEELGAKVVTIPGDNIVTAMMQYARTHNVTQIIVGKAIRPRWLELLRGSLVDELIQKSGKIDIYIISSSPNEQHPVVEPILQTHSSWQKYLPALILVAIITEFGILIDNYMTATNLVMFYLLGVVIAAIRFGRGPSLLTAVLSVLAFDFFFVEPHLTFAVSDAQYLVTFAALLIVGLVIATLAARVKEHANDAQRREMQTTALYALSREMSASMTMEVIVKAVVQHVQQTFQAEVGVFLPQNGKLLLNQSTEKFPQEDSEQAVAMWVYDHAQPAGQGTDTLPASAARYLPLKAGPTMVGVLGVRFEHPEYLTPDQRRLLDAFASQAALGIDATHLAEQAQQAELLRETEKLQTALLNSISHDLRTPLVAITGTLSSLRDQREFLTPEANRELIQGAWEEADRLNRLVGNLLEMTRLEANAIALKKVPVDVQELVGVALSNLKERLASHEVFVEIPNDLPMMNADFVLMVQVLTNLLDNAAKYAPPGTLIEMTAEKKDEMVEIHVADRGKGIKVEDLEKIFHKFYRVENSRSGGIGLGLSICQGLVEAHGGKIWAQNRVEGGAEFIVALPIYQG